MATRTVITRTRRAEAPVSREFVFTRDMVPAVSANGHIPGYIKDFRLKAWDLYESIPLPTIKDEPWRRTDLKNMPAGAFLLPTPELAKKLTPPSKALLAPIAGKKHGGQLELTAFNTNRMLAPELEELGVIFTDLATAERDYPQQLDKVLGKVVRPEEGKFAALSASMAKLGAFVYIPRNVQLEAPLHSILWGPGANLAYFSHILVYLEEGSALTYVHEAASPTEKNGQSMHAGLVEIIVGKGAQLRFVELQSWGEHVWNFSHERVRVEKDGNLDWIFGAMGSKVTKNFSEIDLAGEGATGRMSGFYFADGIQHLDHDTQQNHLAPHTTSDLLFKGALKDHSRSVWQGMIYVAPGAQKADGYQANRNLVLSHNARADSIPGLEILADDVRCTHGATVGQIDKEMVFYMRSRGLAYDIAERLVVEGFFEPIMQRIPFEGVRNRFRQAILKKMNAGNINLSN